MVGLRAVTSEYVRQQWPLALQDDKDVTPILRGNYPLVPDELRLLHAEDFRDDLRGRSLQRRGPCSVHGQPTDLQGSISVHLGKKVCQCFQADCAVQGNVLDLWAAIHRWPLYEATLHLTETFHLHRNREEEHVKGTRWRKRTRARNFVKSAVITADGA